MDIEMDVDTDIDMDMIRDAVHAPSVVNIWELSGDLL